MILIFNLGLLVAFLLLNMHTSDPQYYTAVWFYCSIIDNIYCSVVYMKDRWHACCSTVILNSSWLNTCITIDSYHLYLNKKKGPWSPNALFMINSIRPSKNVQLHWCQGNIFIVCLRNQATGIGTSRAFDIGTVRHCRTRRGKTGSGPGSYSKPLLRGN